VVSILAPVGATDSTATIVPRCSVYNYSSLPATFPVTYRISGPVTYNNTQTVNNLPAGSGIAVSFAAWTVGPRGNYTTRCSTEVNPDTNRANDAVSDSFRIIVHDVATLEILAPRGVIQANSMVTPQAIFSNYGTESETFDVSLVVLTTPPASWTQNITLNPGQTNTINFAPPWIASPAGTHSVRCSTSLASDSIPGNNLQVEQVTVWDDDAGVVSILAPVGATDSTATIVPRCSVYNYSSLPATFPVTYRISGPATYTNTQTVNNLPGGSGIAVSFAAWTVGPRGNYTTRCSTEVNPDTNRANDAVSDSFRIIVHDVATLEILAPRGAVQANLPVTPQAVVQSFGTETETFDVSLVILTVPPASRTISVTLTPGEIDTVSFLPWVAAPVGVYQVRCSTELANDSIAANNLQIDTVIVSDEDVGVTAIFYPTGVIDSTTTLIPSVEVFNYGSNPATFPVIFRIAGPVNYADTQTVNNLLPSTADTVNFNAWTIGPRGNYTTQCTTAFVSDTGATNDTLSGAFEIIVHDVSANQILAPRGLVNLNTSINPRAIISNLGTEVETLDVSLVVLTAPPAAWTDSGRVMNPGQTDTVNFAPPWTASPVGIYQVRCSTDLAGDSIPVNNLQIDTVEVVDYDVGVIAIIYPVGVIDSSVGTLIPQASIRNYASVAVNFPTIFQISGPTNWADTQTVNLGPGQTDTINFVAWTVGPLGNYTTRCTTGLVGDLNPNNNFRDSVFRVRGAGGNVGVTALILNPAGPSVDSGTTVSISARVKNFGTVSADFPVITTISTFYVDTQPVTNLNPGDSITLSFDDWLAIQRGSHMVRCSTALVGDIDSTDDRRTRTMQVLVRDAATVSILRPIGNNDSVAGTIIPQATVRNLGNMVIDSFPVYFTINGPVTWTDFQMVRNLPAGQPLTIDFNAWTIGPVGAYTTSCTTAYALDMNPANDRRTSQFWIQRCDISVDSIISPLGTIDSSSTATVQASVTNFGTSIKTFLAIFRIGTFYNDSLSVTLASGEDSIVTFDNWIVAQPEGIYPVQCTTVIANDINDVNNQDTGSVRVRVKDAAIDSILYPVSVIPPGRITPQARVCNNGGDSASFYTYFMILDDTATVYIDSFYVDRLAPDTSQDISFLDWDATAGIYTARCSLSLAGDMMPTNDTLSLIFNVAERDVGVTRIVYPGRQTLRGAIQPRTMVKNYSSVTESFWSWFSITEVATGTLVYFDSVYCSNLPGWREQILDFPIWFADSVNFGSYDLVSYTALLGDANPANDTAIGSVRIDSVILPKWAQRADVPYGPRARAVKHGGSITYGGNDQIFALKGANTNEFYSYDINLDAWKPKDTMPYSPYRRKRVKRGAALCYDGRNTIYAIKGSNTLEFWAYTYTAVSDTWLMMIDVPPGARRIKGGSDIVYVTYGGDEYVYCLKGSKTPEFYAYSVGTNTWIPRSPVPPGPRNKAPRYGSCMTYDRINNKIYVLKGYYNEFYEYDIATDVWTVKADLPIIGFSGVKKVKHGAALAADESGHIYAFKGNNTLEFWIYHTDEDWWEQTEPIPLGPSYRKVKYGGNLCYAPNNGRIYALKGNKTFEFWVYDPSLKMIFAEPPSSASPSGNMESDQPELNLTKFKVTPNPNSGRFALKYNVKRNGSVRLRLYNVLGELVFEKTGQTQNGSGIITVDATELSAGIYVMKVVSGNQQFVGKVLIQK
ncbi:MAG: T9SS type A sorting domain-containing protein, partial [candidate division WOR-3 bacterium]|nr:T9SS type A sorting domain-containing protein [candidate division WOR-3 bacterium]